MLGRLIKGMAGVVDLSQEHEIPEWMGALLDGSTSANGLLIKGAGHKYLRRVPKAGGGYRYFYNVTGGQGIGHASEMVAGAAFKVKHAGKEGHFHITQDHGDEVTVKHDESGHEQKMSKTALRAMLHAEHAEALGALRRRLNQAKRAAFFSATPKQRQNIDKLLEKYQGQENPKDIRDFAKITMESEQSNSNLAIHARILGSLRSKFERIINDRMSRLMDKIKGDIDIATSMRSARNLSLLQNKKTLDEILDVENPSGGGAPSFAPWLSVATKSDLEDLLSRIEKTDNISIEDLESLTSMPILKKIMDSGYKIKSRDYMVNWKYHLTPKIKEDGVPYNDIFFETYGPHDKVSPISGIETRKAQFRSDGSFKGFADRKPSKLTLDKLLKS